MRRRLALLAAFALFALIWPLAAQAASYDELLAQAKRGDPAIDYQALRYTYAASPAYRPYGGPESGLKLEMFKAFNAGDCAKASTLADQIVDIVYVNIDAHIVGDLCYRRLKNTAAADVHLRVAQGLLHSILASGDGKDPATAYVVISVDEEYSLLSSLGYRVEQQSLVKQAGHSFDRLEARNGDTNDVFYFNVDRPLGTLQHQMQRK